MRIRWGAVLLSAGLLVAGCGSSSDQSGGASTPTPAPSPATSTPSGSPESSGSATASGQLCADASALQASVGQLTTVTVAPGAVTELQNDFTNVQSSLSTLADSARTEWQTQIAALRASLTTLQTSISQLASNPGVTTVAAAKAALVGVGTAARSLFAAADASCPSLSPSPSG